jgi:hypothetical protein
LSCRGIAAAISALALTTSVVALSRPADAAAEPRGLWSTSFSSGQSAADCDKWRLDENGFCVANDTRNGLELGTKFTTSRVVQVTGVRIYRADPGQLRASLWTSDGTLLAQGTFADRADNGWQDMRFTDPVTIQPGTTYIASYFSPATKYAFQYRYFRDSARTVGPITALRSRDDDPNGVHCYQTAACSFPTRGFRKSTYWVTPLWVDKDAPADPSPGGKPTRPQVSATTPSPSATGVVPGTHIKVRFSEPVRRKTLTTRTVRLLRKGSAKPVPVDLHYDARRGRLVLDPRTTLHRGTKYRVVITTRVRDLDGHRLDQNPKKPGNQAATWTFRTRG